VCAAAGASLAHFARRAGQGGSREHAVLGSDPALADVTHERWHRFFDGRGADYAGVADLH